jgi:hypothetical protein
METMAGLEHSGFELTPDDYLARQDRIFNAAANAVLGLGTGFLNRFDNLVVVETKATAEITDACLFISGSAEAEKPIFVVLDVKRKSGWLFRKSYRVGVYSGLPRESVAPLLRLCDPKVTVDGLEPEPDREPLVVQFSRALRNKDIVGCQPGYFARMDIVGGRINLGMYRLG